MVATLTNTALLQQMRDTVGKSFLPQIARVFAPERIVNSSGIWSDDFQSAPVIYNGKYALAGALQGDIPCRLDPTRLYRDANRFGQEVIVNEFTIYFPYDFTIIADYTIVLDGGKYEVRKIIDDQGWGITKYALVVRIDQNA